jgi:type II secretory pathway component PulJ
MAAHPTTHRRTRPGTTLVELMVALTITAIALLSLVGTSAVLLRSSNRSALDARLLAAADLRLESLAAQPCTLLAGGESDAPPVRERWTIAPARHSATIAVTASAPFGATIRTATRATRVRCEDAS